MSACRLVPCPSDCDPTLGEPGVRVVCLHATWTKIHRHKEHSLPRFLPAREHLGVFKQNKIHGATAFPTTQGLSLESCRETKKNPRWGCGAPHSTQKE